MLIIAAETLPNELTVFRDGVEDVIQVLAIGRLVVGLNGAAHRGEQPLDLIQFVFEFLCFWFDVVLMCGFIWAPF